jgi:hypothetical protein
MINQMSSSMRNFMEAYSAVHNKEAKEEFYSHKDEISEMDFSLINQTELDDIAEEVLEELFEEGYSVEQCEAIFEEVLTEARVTYGSDTESPRAKKMSAVKSSLKGAMGKVKEKAAKGAVKSYGAYRSAKQSATDKANRLKQSASNASAVTMRKAKDAKAGIKSGIKGMIGKAAKKVGDAANKVSSRMSEGTVRKDIGDIYQAIYEKKADKDYDGDGEVESGKDEYFGSRDKAIKKAMGKKGKCEKCGKDPCECDKKEVEEGYKGKHGQTDKQYADSRSSGGKMVSGDSKMSGAEYTHGRRVKAANPGMQPDVGGKTKPKSQGKMDRGTRADIQYRKAALKKEEYIDEMGKSDQGVRDRMKISGYEPPTNWDKDANRGKGATVSPKQAEKRRRKSLRKEENDSLYQAYLSMTNGVEQLDELSKKTMGSYVKKAAKDVEKRSYSQGSTDAEDAEIGYPGQTPKDKKIDKRQKGIGRAVGRLTRKEEVTFSEAELKAIQAKVDAWDLDEAQMARNNPEKYERDSRKSETSGQKAERNVRGRLKTMDPDKAEAMKKQMRAVGLNV